MRERECYGEEWRDIDEETDRHMDTKTKKERRFCELVSSYFISFVPMVVILKALNVCFHDAVIRK